MRDATRSGRGAPEEPAIDPGRRALNDDESYLFDLRGYLVLRELLTAEELDRVRQEVAAMQVVDSLGQSGYVHAGFPDDYFDDGEWAGARGPRYARGSYLLDWGPAVRSLVAHPRLTGYLRGVLGPHYRLDHAYGIFARGNTGPHPLHNGGTPFDPSQMYAFRDGRIFTSMVVALFALTSAGDGDGGFCCIPGSHKANLPLPEDLGSRPAADLVVQPSLGAGDVLLFTEAVTHGALPWQAGHDRIALLYKYCYGGMQWERSSPFVSGSHQWERGQEQVLAPPYVGGRPPVG